MNTFYRFNVLLLNQCPFLPSTGRGEINRLSSSQRWLSISKLINRALNMVINQRWLSVNEVVKRALADVLPNRERERNTESDLGLRLLDISVRKDR